MYSKEKFKEMSDKDILDKYSRFDCFYYEEQLLMLDELKERKHITQEERDNTYEKVKELLEKRNEENRKYQKPEKKGSSKKLKLYYILIVFVCLNHTNITHLIAIGFDMMGFHSGYVFMLKTTYVLDFREKSALPTKLLADDYFWKGDYENAQKYYSNAHAFAQHENRNKKIKNKTELTALAGDALTSLYLGNHSRFEGDEWQIVELGEKFKNNVDKLMTSYKEVFDFYGEVSKFFDEKQNYDKSLQYLYKREKYVEPWHLYSQYKSIGDIYLKKHDYKNAELYYTKVMEFNSKNFDNLPNNIKDLFFESLKLNKESSEKNLKKIREEKN